MLVLFLCVRHGQSFIIVHVSTARPPTTHWDVPSQSVSELLTLGFEVVHVAFLKKVISKGTLPQSPAGDSWTGAETTEEEGWGWIEKVQLQFPLPFCFSLPEYKRGGGNKHIMSSFSWIMYIGFS